MHVAGGLKACMHNDFMLVLIKVGVDETNLSAVTDIDHAGSGELLRMCIRSASCAHRPAPMKSSWGFLVGYAS